MASLRRVKIRCDPPLTLDSAGYAELVGMVQEHMAEADAQTTYQVTGLVLEVEPVPGEPEPLTGEPEPPTAESKETAEEA